jgi:4'-phosphopantetheinyl transferase
MQTKAGEPTLSGFFVGARQCGLSKQSSSLCCEVDASTQQRTNHMGDRDIHQAFARALPSQDWCSQPLLVALADVRDWMAWLPAALALLDDAEDLRMRRKRNPGDREVLTLTYALHRLLLGHILDMDPAAVPLWRDAAGCPRVGNNLVHTSLSHAGDRIALAVSRVGPVGVDIEPLVRTHMLLEMAESVCTRPERAAVEALAIGSRGTALLGLWVRKEALLKAAGTGLSVEMSSFDAPEGAVRPMPILEARAWLEMLDAGPDCLAALARPVDVVAAAAWLFPAPR